MFAKQLLILALASSASAMAAPVTWTDWTSVTATAPGAIGVLATTTGNVNVTFSGSYSFVQTGCGTAYWDTGTYNGTLNKPLSCDIVALNAGGNKTISFDTAVVDPYIALMSWNSNTVTFSDAFEVVSNGPGYWGSGTPVLNGDSTGFVGAGEVHAIIRFTGTFSSISFTDTSENWHGFTVGVAGKAAEVPEPSTLALLMPAVGLALVAARRRRMRSAA